MKKLIVGVLALSVAGAFAPVAASAKPLMHRHHHCQIVKKRELHHGRWIVRTIRVCR